MNALLTHPLARLAAAWIAWAGLAALGWWWHQPAPLPGPAAAAAQPPAPPAIRGTADLSRDPLASRLQALDPFALKRTAAAPTPGTATTAGAGGDDIVWRFAALTENRGQRQLVMTANEHPPLLLKAGDKLPNGERIKSIGATGVLLQDAKGRKRTIQLIEP
ncbi:MULTISPECIES: hypothetical protein [unclassified Roseateles]|uniref:hypothetical protein n=1 Tax=unclassified Roseateles TaxID=2626991 RepID=UPI0006F75F29|nr:MULTISPECIES: hypothetical protein [unclassified Roseateles]KQW42094.1 hypothetical protein ASC81_22600 [Pelomonas sp. Root405]KRA67697.1 hypothetical protein ASD88_24185 [Pelomonas sp. Root662]